MLISDAEMRREHGSYLRNVRFGAARQGSLATCSFCGAPVDGYEFCIACSRSVEIVRSAGLAPPVDGVSFLTYAVELGGPGEAISERQRGAGRQAYRTLQQYKRPTFNREGLKSVAEWTAWWLERGPVKPGASIDPNLVWAMPSSRRSGREGEHPLERVVSAVIPRSVPRIEVSAREGHLGRGLDLEAYEVSKDLSGRKVLLVDDTWATGSTVLSAGAALKAAGASAVYAMVLGRALNSAWEPTRRFIEMGGLSAPFDMKPLWSRWPGGGAVKR